MCYYMQLPFSHYAMKASEFVCKLRTLFFLPLHEYFANGIGFEFIHCTQWKGVLMFSKTMHCHQTKLLQQLYFTAFFVSKRRRDCFCSTLQNCQALKLYNTSAEIEGQQFQDSGTLWWCVISHHIWVWVSVCLCLLCIHLDGISHYVS